jgi:hypothetical protein
MTTFSYIASVVIAVGAAWLVRKVAEIDRRVERLEWEVKQGLGRLYAVEKQVYPQLEGQD